MVNGLERYLCGTVVIARDEENRIEACLESLRNQSVTMCIVVVNDGSIDGTKRISSQYADLVVDLPRHDESWTGKPELAKVFNAGFEALENMNIEFVLISGSDCIYPLDYVETLIGRMRDEQVVVSSGVVQGEATSSYFPRGGGRVIDAEWFGSVSFRYPENYGFEGYFIYKALSKGRKVNAYPDIKFKLSRITQLTNNKLFLWGKGMRAMNYSWWYALGRALKMALGNPSGGYHLLKGYFSKVHFYEDIKDFVPGYQRKMILARGRKVVMDVFR